MSRHADAVRELEGLRFPDGAAAGIPKLLHQTNSIGALPNAMRDNIAELRRLNPDWDVRLYDDHATETFVAEHYGSGMLAEYRRIDRRYGPARADLFRYLCLYKLGGVYLDLKSTATKPLNDVIQPDDVFLLSQWQEGPASPRHDWGLHTKLRHVEGGEYQQWFIVAAPGHPFLFAVALRVLRNIEAYHPKWGGVGKPGVLALTGPIAYTLAIHPIREAHSHRRIDICKDGGFRYSIFSDDYVHFGLTRQHYTKLRAPIVRLGSIDLVFWLGYRFIRKSITALRLVGAKMLRRDRIN